MGDEEDMTIQEAVEIVNKHKYEGFAWTYSTGEASVHGDAVNMLGVPVIASYSAETIIRAAKRLREKEAASD